MRKPLFDELLIFSRKAVLEAVNRAVAAPGDQSGAADGLPERWPLALDGTAGKGVDTEFLARAVESNGQVLAFDVQDEAVNATRERLEKAGVTDRVRLIQDSHERLAAYLDKDARITAAMYNLGFLPGGGSNLSTLAETTLVSLEQLQERMAPGGVISVHCYTGHEAGPDELAAVEAWAAKLSWPGWRVLRYEFRNKPVNREVLFLAHRV